MSYAYFIFMTFTENAVVESDIIINRLEFIDHIRIGWLENNSCFCVWDVRSRMNARTEHRHFTHNYQITYDLLALYNLMLNKIARKMCWQYEKVSFSGEVHFLIMSLLLFICIIKIIRHTTISANGAYFFHSIFGDFFFISQMQIFIYAVSTAIRI